MFRQLARPTEKFAIRWDPPLEAVPVTEEAAAEIGAFLLRIDHPLHRDCEPGTLRGATRYNPATGDGYDGPTAPR